MNRAVIPTSDEEREARMAKFRADMAQLETPEPAEESGRLPTIILTAAIVLICAAAVWLM